MDILLLVGYIVRKRNNVMNDNIVEAYNLSVHFPIKSGICSKSKYLRAVHNVSLKIPRGSIVGLAGESGSGKTTVGKALLRLIKVASGKVLINKQDILAKHVDLKALRRENQIIFQDPLSSLNPSKTIYSLLEAPLRVHNIPVKQSVIEKTLASVGLDIDVLMRYPHEFSGGQLQRICIARALLLQPKFLVCDEVVASLDVSIQSQIINLFNELREEHQLTYLFISHNIALLKYMCDEIGVMYLGEIVEYAQAGELFENPKHPYTCALLKAIPVPDPEIERIRVTQPGLQGEVPSPIDPPLGCAFSSRCPDVHDICHKHAPIATLDESKHMVKCWLYK